MGRQARTGLDWFHDQNRVMWQTRIPWTAGKRARGGDRDGRAWNRRGPKPVPNAQDPGAHRVRRNANPRLESLGNMRALENRGQRCASTAAAPPSARVPSRPASTPVSAERKSAYRILRQPASARNRGQRHASRAPAPPTARVPSTRGPHPGPSLKLEREAVPRQAPRISSTVYPSARSASTARRSAPSRTSRTSVLNVAHREHRDSRAGERPGQPVQHPDLLKVDRPLHLQCPPAARGPDLRGHPLVRADDAQLALAPGDGHEARAVRPRRQRRRPRKPRHRQATRKQQKTWRPLRHAQRRRPDIV